MKANIERVWMITILCTIAAMTLVFLIPILFEVNYNNYGDYGSFVGGLVGTAIGGVTVLLVYKTYRLQQQELKLSREELSLTRKELELTREQLGIQNFEITFFNLLNSLTKISEELKGSGGGQDAFETAVRFMKDTYLGNHSEKAGEMLKFLGSFRTTSEPDTFESRLKSTDYKQEPHLVLEHLKSWKSRHGDDEIISYLFNFIYQDFFDTRLNKYYRFIKEITVFITNSFSNNGVKNDSQIKKYSNILAIHLSSFELALLLYNCINDFLITNDKEKREFRIFVNKYDIIRTVDYNLLLSPRHINKLVQIAENDEKFN